MTPPGPTQLPIEVLRAAFVERLAAGPVVVSAPTGSGKSTRVPVWCVEAGGAPVLVIEPRRVACRSLAVRVAQLDGSPLGRRVGYSVRDDHRARPGTELLFATPGIVLRMLAAPARQRAIARFGAVVLDEFHERSLDVDLILALLQSGRRRPEQRLVVMSATLDGDAVAGHLGGSHLIGEGRAFPVEVHYVPGEALLPDARGLEIRLGQALDRAARDPGDVLVFLPGKAEIASAAAALRGRPDLEVLPLHGGLSLDEQSRAFRSCRRRKVILATNVAETSITLPGVGVVIDSGLVRQTRYLQGRGFLVRVPVADDSAEQRAGRAGRTAPGVCYRLWSRAAKLNARTLPELHRESLVPLVLAAGACHADAGALPFLDPPKAPALEAAVGELRALGALDTAGDLSDRGRRLFGLPLDAHLGRLLVEAEGGDALADVVDLVSVLAVDRPLFGRDRPADPADDLRAAGCDATAAIRALREGDPERHRLLRFTLGEARRIAGRLRRAFGLPERCSAAGAKPIDRRRLAMIAMAADSRCVHVVRRRGRKVAWSNGGTELLLARESALAASDAATHRGDQVEAIAVLRSRALGLGRDTTILAICAIPLALPWLVAAGLGRDRLAGVSLVKGRLSSRVERIYARRVLEVREEAPSGALAREAVRDLFLRGRIFREALEATRDRLQAAALAARLGLAEAPIGGGDPGAWVLARLEAIGLESADDLELLSPSDLLAPALPPAVGRRLERDYPRTLSLGDARYRIDYDLAGREVSLVQIGGQRRGPPPVDYLPPFKGFRVVVRDRSRAWVLRER